MLPSRRNAYFYKIDVFASSPKIYQKTIDFRPPKINEKSKKIVKKTCLKTCWLLTSIFNDFGLHFASQVGPKFRIPFDFFDVFLQDRPNMAPRASQERPKSAPRASKMAPGAAKNAPRASKTAPRASQSSFRAPREHRNMRKSSKIF